MSNQDSNAGNQNDLPTYLGPWGPRDQAIDDVRWSHTTSLTSWASHQSISPCAWSYETTKVSPAQNDHEYKWICNKKKLTEMGWREEIMLEREIVSPIILPESVATILINPYFNEANICIWWLIFIYAQRITTCRGLRGNEISEENFMASWRRG